jgi:hypothetical protein
MEIPNIIKNKGFNFIDDKETDFGIRLLCIKETKYGAAFLRLIQEDDQYSIDISTKSVDDSFPDIYFNFENIISNVAEVKISEKYIHNKINNEFAYDPNADIKVRFIHTLHVYTCLNNIEDIKYFLDNWELWLDIYTQTTKEIKRFDNQ